MTNQKLKIEVGSIVSGLVPTESVMIAKMAKKMPCKSDFSFFLSTFVPLFGNGKLD